MSLRRSVQRSRTVRSRQVSWIDYDNDGDVDLFAAFLDRSNMLLRNDDGRFINVAPELGLDDPRRTVGVVWFDMDQDGDLDVFVANSEGQGDLDGFFRNDGTRFVDVAGELGMDGATGEAGRPSTYGGIIPSLADFDNDGDLDLFVANYGPNALYRNDGGGKFTDVAPELGVAGDYHAVTASWGDYDNDGRVDLYVSGYLSNSVNVPDHFYRNEGSHFSEAFFPAILRNDASHGVQWADFDGDGDLDLSLANNHALGTHYVFRNLQPPERSRRSVQVLVLDESGRYSRAGSEVRVYQAGTRDLLGTGIVDTGGGYCSQNVMPVHVGLPTDGPVDVEVTALTSDGRKVTRVPDVDPSAQVGKPLVVKVNVKGESTTN